MDKIRVKPNLSIFKRLPVKNQNENIQSIALFVIIAFKYYYKIFCD